jgi:hypothetical protein
VWVWGVGVGCGCGVWVGVGGWVWGGGGVRGVCGGVQRHVWATKDGPHHGHCLPMGPSWSTAVPGHYVYVLDSPPPPPPPPR